MRTKFYPEELRAQAVRLVVERKFSAAEAAAQLGLRSEVVRVWVRRFRSLKRRGNEIGQLQERLREIVMEREALVRLAAQLMDRSG